MFKVFQICRKRNPLALISKNYLKNTKLKGNMIAKYTKYSFNIAN